MYSTNNTTVTKVGGVFKESFIKGITGDTKIGTSLSRSYGSQEVSETHYGEKKTQENTIKFSMKLFVGAEITI